MSAATSTPPPRSSTPAISPACSKEDVPLAARHLADILQNSLFDQAELEREQQVIVQEIGAARDNPDDHVFDLFQQAPFPTSRSGRTILGTVESVRSFSTAARSAIMDAQLCRRPDGDVRRRQCRARRARRHRPTPLPRSAPDRRAEVPTPRAMWRRARGCCPSTSRPTSCSASRANRAYNSDGFYAAQIFASILGGGMSSRLFQEVREKRGLCYSVYAGAGARDVPELCNVALDALARASADLTDEEVARARAQMKVSLLAALESSGARAEQMARQMLAHGRLVPREEVIAKIDAVDVAATRRVGAEILRGAPTIAAIGPVARAPDPAGIARRLNGV
jgi:predicted Zn-dependent peptidase